MAELAQVGDADFESEVLQSEGPVVVDFWAPWCGPCRVVGPILSDMADEHERITFLKLNVDENPATQARYNVLSIPTVILFEGGEARDIVVGARSRSHYESVWDRWLRPAAALKESQPARSGSTPEPSSQRPTTGYPSASASSGASAASSS